MHRAQRDHEVHQPGCCEYLYRVCSPCSRGGRMAHSGGCSHQQCVTHRVQNVSSAKISARGLRKPETTLLTASLSVLDSVCVPPHWGRVAEAGGSCFLGTEPSPGLLETKDFLAEEAFGLEVRLRNSSFQESWRAGLGAPAVVCGVL